jgi:hypothetical protein
MGDGIRGSKDLRARVRKFLSLTNERKQMSNKTLKQRIAVVAASALTAGFLSVVAMPTANAAGEGLITVSTTTGSVVAPTTTASVGTGTIASTGSVKLGVAAGGASVVLQLRISGGTFTGVTSGANISADGTVAQGDATTTAIVGLDAKPTGAGRNMVIKSYQASSGTAAVTSAVLATLDASTTFTSSYTFTVVAAGTAGVASAGNSRVVIMNNGSAGTTIASGSILAAAIDLTDANVVGAGGLGMLAYTMYDVNGSQLNTATTTSTATVKSGACVVGTSTTTSIITSAYASAAFGAFYVAQADSTNTPAITCTVEVAANGTTVATKTFTFQGPLAAISVTSLVRGTLSAGQTAMGNIVATDSAGNLLAGVTITGAIVNAADVATITAVSVSASTTVKTAGLNGGVIGSSTAPATIGYSSSGVATNGTDVQFKSPNGIGGFVLSPVYKIQTSGTGVTYTAGFDKASYVPGDIATLTVTGKDSKGFLANDTVVIASGSTGEVATLQGSQMTLVGGVTTDKFGSGAGTKTYKFVVGSTEGSYNMIVEYPLILTSTNKSVYGAAVQTVAYKVSAGTTAVSNADVLKSIVALIASINKQIQALQKLILKR